VRQPPIFMMIPSATPCEDYVLLFAADRETAVQALPRERKRLPHAAEITHGLAVCAGKYVIIGRLARYESREQ
jgi:hypothetical protein